MTAKEEDELPTRQEVEQIVNDNRIPWDVRRDLALQYIDYVEDEDPEECGFADEADRNGFRDAMKAQMKISEGDLNLNNLVGGVISDLPGVPSLEQDVHRAYSTAKDAYDKLREGDRQADQNAVNGGKSALDGLSNRASATNAGVGNSNEILDAGVPGLKSFEIFIPLYNRAIAKVGGWAPGDINEIHRLYDQQRNILFDKFSAGADEFTKLKESVDHSLADVSGQLNDSLGGWHGAASDQAKRYRERYEKQTKTVADAGEHAATAMLTATGSVGKFCREKAKWVLDYYFDRLGAVTAQDLERIIRIAELEGNASQDDFKHCAKFLNQEAQNKIADESCDLNDETITYVVGQVNEYLRTVFCPWFGKHIENFRLMCVNTRNAVDGAWKALSDFLLTLPENAYVDVDKDTDHDSDRTPGPSSGTDRSGVGIPEPVRAPNPPEEPRPVVPDPAVNPVTHQPLEADPKTGKPYPIDPVTGMPVRDAVPDRDTLTIQQGTHRISIDAPGPDGKMAISVDDGTGHPKDYKLDFADGGAHPLPDGPTQHDLPRGATGYGLSDKSYQTGPDGRILIEEGALKITAERPGGFDGETVITVDDGMSEPVKYTFGEPDGQHGLRTHAGLDGEATGSLDPVNQAESGRHAAAADVRSDASGARAETVTAPHGPAGGDSASLSYLAASEGQVSEPLPATAMGESTSPQSVYEPLNGIEFFGTRSAVGELDSVGDIAAAGTDTAVGPPSSLPVPELGSAPGGTDTDLGTSVGGIGMMSGIGGAGSGSGGEDQQRVTGAYRVDGELFDTAAAGGRISGSLDDDNAIGTR